MGELERKTDCDDPEHRDVVYCIQCSDRDIAALEKKLSDAILQNDLWRKYVALLGEELREIAPIAFDLGWRSTRHEEGKKLREQLGLGEYWGKTEKRKDEGGK